MSRGILTGVRVIELASGIPGPVAGLQLFESGAEVIKVEPPGGDPDGRTPGFSVWNRGKRRWALDLEIAEGRAALERVLAASDVLIHGYTPVEAQRLGVDEDRLAAIAPHLIVAGVTGWPANHPDAERPGRETLILARLGILSEQPGSRPGPVFVRMPFASFAAAWLLAIGIMARLLQRRQGRGAGPVRTSLAQGALVPMTMHWARAQRPSASFAKGLDKNTAIAIHQCADGRWIHVHYSPDAAPLMKAGLDALGPDAVAQANAECGTNHTAPNFGGNRKVFATRPAREWLEHLWAHDIAAQEAAPFGEIYFDEQARVNGYVAEVQDSRFGATLQPGPCYAVTPPAQVRGPLRPVETAVSLEPPPSYADTRRAQSEPPLTGLRVLDFGAYLAGPFGAMLLADLGADVVKVEPPSGEFMRYLERVFCGAQRGKRSVALQLKDAGARPALEALVRWADCFHHNVRMPAARKLGIDYAVLSEINPRIVGCHVSSYGPNGPRADWPGFDQLFQACCGWEVEDGGEGNPPMWLRFGITDHLAALSSTYALLLGLFERERTGRGQMTAASLLGATILTTSETVVHPDGSLEGFARLDHDQTGVAPEHRLYRCLDGWVAVAAIRPEEAQAFREIIGGEPVTWFAGRTVAEADELLSAAAVAAEVVNTDQLDAFLDSPAMREAGLVASYDHATMGRMRQVGAFWSFGEAMPKLDRAAPAIGQHSREVLLEAGLDEATIDGLVEARVLAGTCKGA